MIAAGFVGAIILAVKLSAEVVGPNRGRLGGAAQVYDKGRFRKMVGPVGFEPTTNGFTLPDRF